MTNQVGRPPGPIGDGQPVSLFSTRCGLTLTAISGGAIDVSGGVDGSDIIRDIIVSTHPTEDLLGGDDVTWATSDTVFARLIAQKINDKAGEHHYWATSATDHVYIWPQDGSVADTGTISFDDESFTATGANMNVEQAFVAAVNWTSPNYGVDAFADTKMYRIGFDSSIFWSNSTDWEMDNYKGIELDLNTEDQTLTMYCGPGGYIALSATPADNAVEERTFDMYGVALGIMDLFAQSGAAQNPVYKLRGW